MSKSFKIIVPSLTVLLLIVVLSSFVFPLSTSAEESSAPKNLIPIMTSNDSPLGHATASSIWASRHQPFNLFNGIKDDAYGWATSQTKPFGWVAYEFDSPVVINQFALWPRSDITQDAYKNETPKDFTFDAWDGDNWIVLHSETNVNDWQANVEKVFSFSNEKSYTKYRLNIINNNGLSGFTALGEMEMYHTVTATPEPTALPTSSPTPIPTNLPTPTPDVPSGDRALLTIELSTGTEKEYDLSISEVNAFLNWYDSANGSARYGIDKHDNNKGPFSKRTEYVIHDKILTFEVSEYTAQ